MGCLSLRYCSHLAPIGLFKSNNSSIGLNIGTYIKRAVAMKGEVVNTP